jgi:hypothetical protein
MSSDSAKTDYDSPWKDILEHYFPQFMAFFAPPAYDEIDWSRDYTFLDKELQQVVPQAETGSRRVDKLVKVFLRDGQETWLLIHIEIQGQREDGFPKRMYIYNYRIFDLYGREVISLAVLTDEHRNWRPSHYSYERWGCRISLDFPIIKLLDYTGRQEELVASTNPFAVVVLAHLQTLATRRDPASRYDAKLKLAKQLYRKGYGRQDIINLFRFIDWIMTLPSELDGQLQVELAQFEEREKMQYVTTIERMAIQKGEQTGLQKGLQRGIRESMISVLEIRFGEASELVETLLGQIEDIEQLRELNRQTVTVNSLAEFEQLLHESL